MKITRSWAMPSKNTFDVRPIGGFVQRYAMRAITIVDPFARDTTIATYRNDLNPNTSADYHMDVDDFLAMIKSMNIFADLVLFDPPFSPEQMKRSYESIGLKMAQNDALRTANWKTSRDIIRDIVPIGGYVLSFGWNSQGMGKKRGFAIEEILLVCHGGGHSDTICVAEKKIWQVGKLF